MDKNKLIASPMEGATLIGLLIGCLLNHVLISVALGLIVGKIINKKKHTQIQ